MLEETKTVLVAEIAKLFIHVDPAPMGGGGLKNIMKALKEDIRDISKNDSSTKEDVK